jgi:hypothetical protein
MEPYKTFTDHSTDLGNLFFAVGNLELSDKVALYMMDQKCLLSKPFYSFGGSYAAMET